MRSVNIGTANQSYSGDMIFPDEGVFLKDANYLNLVFNTTSSNTIVKIQLTLNIMVTDNMSGDSMQKSYTITTNNNVYNINLANYLERFFDFDEESRDLIFDIVLEGLLYTSNGLSISINSFSANFAITAYDGFSLPNRAHGTDTTAFVPDHIGQAEDGVSMYIGSPALLEGENYPAGSIYQIKPEKDECTKAVDVYTITDGGNWKKPEVSWTYGVKSVVIDRCGFDSKSSILQELMDGGFDTSDGDYTPISMRLVPRVERGTYLCEFFGRDTDNNFVSSQFIYGRLLIAREAPFIPLFGINWGYRQSTDYYWIEIGYLNDSEEFVKLEDVKMIVEYDTNPSSTTFSGRPMTAILFKYWDLDIWQGDFEDYIPYFQLEGSQRKRAKGVLCMFGNHLRVGDVDAFDLTQNDEMCRRLMAFTPWGDGFIGYWEDKEDNYGENDIYFLEKADNLTYGQQTQAFFRAYYNNCVTSVIYSVRPIVYDYFHKVLSSGNIERDVFYYSQLNDTYNEEHPMSYGIGLRILRGVTIKMTLNDSRVTTAKNRVVYLIPTNKSNDRVTYISNPITILDNNNPTGTEYYYDYDGNLITDSRRFFVLITMEFPINDNELPNFQLFFDRTQGDMEWGIQHGVVLNDLFNRCNINSLTMTQTTVHNTEMESDYYLPFTCGVPYCLKAEGDNVYTKNMIYMFRKLTVKAETFNESVRQVYKTDEGYICYQNLGRTLIEDGQTVFYAPNFVSPMVQYSNAYRPLGINKYSLYEPYMVLNGYNEIISGLTLRLSPLNGVGFNRLDDKSYVISDGCQEKRIEHQLVGGSNEYTLLSFSMCDATDKPAVWLKYKNMDGLWRYLPLEMLDTTLKNSTQNLQFIKPMQYNINNYPYFNPYALEEKVTCGVYNVPPDMHIEDMLYSRTLELISFDGNTIVSVTLEEDSFTRHYGETEDFILHFIKKQ